MPIVPLPEPSEYERTKHRLQGVNADVSGRYDTSGAFGMGTHTFAHLYSEGRRSGGLTNPDDFPTHITGEPAAGISQFDTVSTEDIYKSIGKMQHLKAHQQGSRPRSVESDRQISEIDDEIGVWDKEMRRRFKETSIYGTELSERYPRRQGLTDSEGRRRLPYPKQTKFGGERRGVPMNGSRAELELGSFLGVSNLLDNDARKRQSVDDPDPYLPPDWSQYFNK